jgi:hypothetical protein
MTNTLAYFGTESITAVKSFIVQSPEGRNFQVKIMRIKTGAKVIKSLRNKLACFDSENFFALVRSF